MRRHALALLVAAAATSPLVACGGSSTKIVNTWKAPDAQPANFKKPVVVYLNRDAAVRRTVEDRMAAKISNALPAYTILPESELVSAEHVRDKLQAAGVDGAIVIRLVGLEKETTYVPGTSWVGPSSAGMWNYWGPSYSAVYDPGYLREDKIATLETRVYAVPGGKLLWASRSETLSPSVDANGVEEVLNTVMGEMKRQKVL